MADTFDLRVYLLDSATDHEVQDLQASALLSWTETCPLYDYTPAGDPTATLETPGTGPNGTKRAWLVTGPVTSTT